jgi:2-hydroxy-3-keto-5-methylthiopentenyl-1-phosphate phosphatase
MTARGLKMAKGSRKHPWIVFCDFDGTITSEETLVGMFKAFVPELYDRRAQQMHTGSITLKAAVRGLIEAIPSERYPEILEYFRRQPIRAGFDSLLEFLHVLSVPLIIVSGGVREMIITRLGALTEKIEAIYAPEVQTDGAFMRIRSDFEGRTELVSKVEVMRRYPYDRAVAIGNGITDVDMSRHASVVFARDFLARWLSDHSVAYFPWDDFNDVRKNLSGLWKTATL